ncbi:MAG: hypothetical protein AAB858_02150 [Patescibacteria group bacterium]
MRKSENVRQMVVSYGIGIAETLQWRQKTGSWDYERGMSYLY